MGDPDSAHVADSTTTAAEAMITTATNTKLGADIHTELHHRTIFIGLIVAFLSCVLIVFIYIIIRQRRLCPSLRARSRTRSRGDSAVMDEIKMHRWKMDMSQATPSSVEIQKNIRHHNDSSGDSLGQILDDQNESHVINIPHYHDNNHKGYGGQLQADMESMDMDNATDDEDIYLEPNHPKISSVGHYSSKHQQSISISANNKLAFQTNGPNIDEQQQLTEHGENGENQQYEWIELALRQIDENEWQTYLERFKQNKVTTRRLHCLQHEDFRELLPEIGVRRDFLNLLKHKP